jgi:CRP-like cAMP-binding protein
MEVVVVSVDLLAKINLFEGVPEEQLAVLATKCKQVSYKAGENIFCEGCEADKLYILLEGYVSLWMKLTSRPENLVLGAINKFGQSFGWSVLIKAAHYTASADAKEDSNMLEINGEDFRNFLEEDKEVGFDIAMRMLEMVSGRLRYYRVLLKTF